MDIVLNVIVDIIALLVTLGILVTIHEFGHFWVARRCDVKVERFSIGFGKALYSWRRGETEYRIAAIPLGGYVKMLGEQNADVDSSEKHRAFNNKPLLQKAAIVSAGPIANFILAVFLYWIMFIYGVNGVMPIVVSVVDDSPAALAGLLAGDEIIEVDDVETETWQQVRLKLLERLGETGYVKLQVKSIDSETQHGVDIKLERWLSDQSEPNLLGSLGISLDVPAEIGGIEPGGRAESSGLLVGDVILSVDDETVVGWSQWVGIIRSNPEIDLSVMVERKSVAQTPLNLTLKPALNPDVPNGGGFIGARVQEPEILSALPSNLQRRTQYSVFSALPRAFSETWNNISFVLDSMKKMLVGLISVENLSGPITIAQVAGQTVEYGVEYFINFLAVLSISLGVLNLLPIPVLDGGHLFYYMIEAIIRRPVPERIQAMGMQFGMFLIVGIMIIAFYNDVNRLL